MSTWHYSQNNQPCGPVDAAALQELLRNRGSGAPLPPDTLVWKEGMANWAPANTIPEFSAVINAPNAPPPLPNRISVPPLSDFAPPPRNAPPPIAPAPASAGDPTRADIDQNKVFAILAYLGILFLVPLLAAPNSPFARYHTNQGIVLFITSLIVGPVSWILGFPLAFFTFGIGLALPFALGVGLLVLLILGIINAANGQCKPLPLIGHFQLIK
jgi:uncharacterized membrane protein